MKYLLIGLLLLGLMLGAYDGIYKPGIKRVISDKVNNDNEKTDEEVYLELIWDASGSMWGREEGLEKILRAKEVLKTITKKAPADINIGLRIFGARKTGDINDSFLAVPVEKNNKKIIDNFIANVRPLGKSPIGLSLQEAKKDLLQLKGKRVIILISDCLDNGSIPPAEVIDNLKKEGIVLNIVYIGDLTNEELKNKLKEITRITGGDFFNYKEDEKVISVLKK